MNLQDLRSGISSLTKYNPDIDEDRVEVDAILNSILVELGVEQEWRFAQRTRKVNVKADQVFTGVTLVLSQNSITLPGTTDGNSEGMICEIRGSNGNDGEYEIVSRASSTEIYVKGLDGSTPSWSAATDVTVTIKHRYVIMPEDCAEVLGLEIRSYNDTRGKFSPITRSEDEDWQLDLDATGTPQGWVPAEDRFVPPPVTAPTLSINNSGVTHPVPTTGTYYVCYTYVWKDIESGPSPVAEIYATSATEEITVSGIQDTGTGSGIRKKIYVKVPGYRAFYASDNSVIDDDSTSLGGPIIIPGTWPVGQSRLHEGGGNWKAVRLYPRQDEDLQLSVRYLHRPRLLIEDTDIPELPPTNHRLLLFRAVEECLNRHESPELAAVWGRKADAQKDKMRLRELNTRARRVVRGNAFEDSSPDPFRTITYETP
ncbi:MAG: hypothetical protein D6722_25130 [Bacteroidetes bacterium]|nr:MAG: hypothetical protein D6722_25130 [Bacteroidota bacterium]